MLNKQPLVSIIMNCYNCEKYLKEALNSIMNQTYQNWEIIFWDNQSTDESAKIVKSYNDDRIKYFFSSTHTTLGEARNKALEKANGEFISFLDCDDLYFPNKIEMTLQYFNKEVVLVFTNGYILDGHKKKVFYKKKQEIGYLFKNWLQSYHVMIPSVMFRKSVLDRLDYWFDSRFNMIEEFDFFIRIALIGKVNYCHNPLCIWRIHKNSLTWQKRNDFEIEYKLFLNKIKQKPFYTKLKKSHELKKIKAKISYHKFYNNWLKNEKPNRNIIRPYLFYEKKLIIIYLISFLGLNI